MGAGSQAGQVTSESTVARDSLSVSFWTLASRTTGLVRMLVAGGVLGPTYLANVYQSTNLLPTLLFQMMAGPLIAAMLVPPIVKHLDSSGTLEARRFANAAFGVVLTAFAIATVAALVGGPLLVRLLTIGVPDESANDAREVTWILLAIAAPQVLLLGVTGVAVAIQQAHGRFAFPAAVQIFENAVVVVVLLFAARVFGVGQTIDSVGNAFLLTIGLGTTVAIAIHATVQWMSARSLGIPLVPSRDWSQPDIREVLRFAGPALSTTGIETTRFLALVVIAGLIPGGVIAMQLGLQFSVLPIALGARPVSQALLPRLSRLRAAGDPRAFSEYQTAIGMVLWIAIPSTLGLAVLSAPLAEAVAFGEMANERGIELIRIAIAAFGLTVLGGSVYEVARQAAYSARDTTGPLRMAVLRSFLALPGFAIVVFWLQGPESLLILGIGAGISDAAVAGLLDRRVRGSALGARRVLRWVARDVVLALLAMAIVLVLLGVIGPRLPDGRIPLLAMVLGAAGLALAVYASAQIAVGSPELAGLHPSFARGRARAPESSRLR